MKHLLGIGGPTLIVGSIVRICSTYSSRRRTIPAGTLGVVANVDDLGPFIMPLGTINEEHSNTVYPPSSDCEVVWID